MTEREKNYFQEFLEMASKKSKLLWFFVGFCEFEWKNRPLKPGGVIMWQLESTPH